MFAVQIIAMRVFVERSHMTNSAPESDNTELDADTVKYIRLSRGELAIVDASDYEYLNHWKWYLSNTGYVVRIIGKYETQKTVYMHKQVVPSDAPFQTDHANQNKLDNRRTNLRIATEGQNRVNVPIRPNNKSGYVGVRRDYTCKSTWIVQLGYGATRFVRRYHSLEEAIDARDKEAAKRYGDFAVLNRPRYEQNRLAELKKGDL